MTQRHLIYSVPAIYFTLQGRAYRLICGHLGRALTKWLLLATAFKVQICPHATGSNHYDNSIVKRNG